MGMCEPLVAELDQEVAATRTLLERVPEEKLSWKPHEKSMTMRALIGHIAEALSWGVVILNEDQVDFDPDKHEAPSPATVADSRSGACNLLVRPGYCGLDVGAPVSPSSSQNV